MKRWVLMLWVIASVSTACGNGQGPSSTPDSGIRGRVTYGPLCPVVQAGSPCPDRPWQGKVQAFTSDGTLAGDAETDQRGAFTLPLEPGTFVITPWTPDGPPTAKSRNVTVVAGAFVQVALQVDSGIR